MNEIVVTTGEDWAEPDHALTARLGMWAFLASEILFFGAIFCAYSVLRYLNPAGFSIASHETDIFFGTANTVILATSAVTMTMAAKAGDFDDRRLVRIFVAITFALGVTFLVLKGLEYSEDISKHLVPNRHFSLSEPSAEMFWAYYWLLTGLHTIHLTVGLGVLARAYWLTRTAMKPDALRRNLDASSLYWHLVDSIWFVIFPAIYLAGRSG